MLQFMPQWTPLSAWDRGLEFVFTFDMIINIIENHIKEVICSCWWHKKHEKTSFYQLISKIFQSLICKTNLGPLQYHVVAV